MAKFVFWESSLQRIPGSPGFPLLVPGFYGLPILTLALYYRRLLLVAMGASLLVFIIYATLFHSYILLFLPVGAKFQQPIVDANASSILVSTSSTTTSSLVPTVSPKIDLSANQSIKTIRTRRINSIMKSVKSAKSIPSWWVLRNRVL